LRKILDEVKNISKKQDDYFVSDNTTEIGVATTCLKDYSKSGEFECFLNFAMKAESGLSNLKKALKINSPNPMFMNVVTTQAIIVENCLKSIEKDLKNETFYDKIVELIEGCKEDLKLEYQA
jgi:ribosomal protein L28